MPAFQDHSMHSHQKKKIAIYMLGPAIIACAAIDLTIITSYQIRARRLDQMVH
jgi:hypothetical protein